MTLLWAEKPTSQQSMVREQSVVHKQPEVREHPGIDKFLNAAEVAARLGLSKSKAYLLMEQGEIPTVRMGRTVRVRPQDLEDFILRRKD